MTDMESPHPTQPAVTREESIRRITKKRNLALAGLIALIIGIVFSFIRFDFFLAVMGCIFAEFLREKLRDLNGEIRQLHSP